MSDYNKGGYIKGGPTEVTFVSGEIVTWSATRGLVIEIVKHYKKTTRKRSAREIKRAAIEARQVRRATVIVNQAAPIIHKGKKP